MGKKKWILIALGVLVPALILAAVLLPRNSQTPETPTAPAVQTRPAGTTVPDRTEPTLPEETEPVETEPAETEPAVTTGPAVETELEPTIPTETEPEPEPTDADAADPQTFPVLLEDGMLVVQSIFQYSGMNPDAELEFGENIAGLQIVNASEQHMTVAELAAVLDDGTILSFRAEDVAPGMEVMAFSLEQGSITDLDRCVEVYGYAEFEPGDHLRGDLVRIQVEGVEITVTNVSGMDLTDLDIICHSLLEGSAFGGRAYTYRITSLASGASADVYALDCTLGMTQVTRVELGE